MALEVTDSNFEELRNSGNPLVLDFWAEWCGPCRMIGPVIDELAKEYEGRVTVGKINVDTNNDVVVQFGVRNIPTVLFFKNGEVVDKIVGAAQRSAFVQKINALLES
jgi:thioredoxin 1